MPVFRVEKTRDYTVMANHHLKDRRLSLKAKGLLSVMLSLPEEWDYTLKGLAVISKEGVDAIRESIRELERAGYVARSRKRDEQGRLKGMECQHRDRNAHGGSHGSACRGTHGDTRRDTDGGTRYHRKRLPRSGVQRNTRLHPEGLSGGESGVAHKNDAAGWLGIPASRQLIS